jgi:hypothetical protein
VEGAQPDVVRARFPELNVALHYVHDVDPIEQVLLKRVGDHTPVFIPKAWF